MQYIKRVVTIFFCFFLFTSCNGHYNSEKVIESWETGNQLLKIRVSSHPQKGMFPLMGSTYHVFESSQDGKWLEFMTVRHDDPNIPIDKNAIKFVGEKVCFVYSGTEYAITTDTGNTWTLWDGQKHNYLDKNIRYGLIKQVEVESDGNGKMMVQIFGTDNLCQTLTTKNYGKNWENGNLTDDCSF